MADGYVTNWGNDNNDGLTWATAKRTFQGLRDAGIPDYGENIWVAGWFAEKYLPRTNNIIFQGGNKTILDFEKTSPGNFTYTLPVQNCIWQNFDLLYTSSNSSIYSIDMHYRKGNTFQNVYQPVETRAFRHINTIMSNIGEIDFQSSDATFSYLLNCTIFNINLMILRYTPVVILDNKNTIISNVTELEIIEKPGNIDYYLFNNVAFKFTGGTGTDEITFEYPTGTSDLLKIQNLRDRMVTVYGGISSDYLVGCLYYSGSYNDIFIDADNEDFNLVPYCIAAHMSYEGDYIGAKPEGHKLDWNADFSSIVNIDSIGNIIDQTIDSTAESDILDIGHIRYILNFSALGQRAARNGQQVNSESNLGSNISPGTSVLTDGIVYMTVDDLIILDDVATTTYYPWDTFTAVEEGTPGNGAGLGFTSTSGAVKEVYIDDRYDPKIQYKCSKTDNTLSTAVTITSKISSSEMLVNVDGNGEPTFGDADIGYDEGTAIALYTRYMQFFIKVKANNLPAR